MPICPICSREAVFTKGKLKSGKHYEDAIFDDVETASCSRCRSTWAVNPPSGEELSRFYNDNYRIARIGKKQKESWPHWDTRAASLIALGRLFTPVRPGLIFLDIGPGGGEALGLAQYMLPKPRLACIEYSQAAIKFYRSVLPQIYAQNSLAKVAEKFENKVQFIYAAHSFEHFSIEDLWADLVRIRDLLTPSGVLVCEVPNVDSAAFEKAHNHVPHLIFFSQVGLRRLLYASGFDVKLCIEAVGKHGEGMQYLENFQEAAAEADMAPELVERLSAINNGDWVGSQKGGVLKCVAKKRR